MNARALAGALALIGGSVSIGAAAWRLPIIVTQVQSTAPPAAAVPGAPPSGVSPPQQRRHRDTSIQSLKALELSDSQKMRIHAVMVATPKRHRSVSERGEIQADGANAQTKIEAILTAAQRAQFDAELDTAAKTP